MKLLVFRANFFKRSDQQKHLRFWNNCYDNSNLVIRGSGSSFEPQKIWILWLNKKRYYFYIFRQCFKVVHNLIFIYLSIPEEFRKTVVQCVSFPAPFGSHPEWGIMTMLTSTKRASSMMILFKSSQDERFHKTPVTNSLTSLSVVFLSRRTRAVTPPAALIALLFSSFCLPYDKFLQDQTCSDTFVVAYYTIIYS